MAYFLAKNRTLISFLLFEIFEFETMATNYAPPFITITITFSNSKYNCFHFPSNNSNGNCVTA